MLEKNRCNPPVICIHGSPPPHTHTYRNGHGIAGLMCSIITFQLSPIFCCVRRGYGKGCNHQLVPTGQGIYQGSEKSKVIIPAHSRRWGAVDTNDWCIKAKSINFMVKYKISWSNAGEIPQGFLQEILQLIMEKNEKVC